MKNIIISAMWLVGTSLLVGCTALPSADRVGQGSTTEWTIAGMKSGAAPGLLHDRQTAATVGDTSRGRSLWVGEAGHENVGPSDEVGSIFRYR